MVSTSQKICFATRNEAFVEKRFRDTKKLVLLARKSRKMVFTSMKIFSFKIGSPNFNNGFQHQKEKL